MRRTKSILFFQPDYHCSFFYRDRLRKMGWKADIFVPEGYPAKQLYSSDDIRRAPRVDGNHRVIGFLNSVLLMLWYLANFWRYRVHFYYGRPPIASFHEERLGLTKLFGSDFLVSTWLAKLFRCCLVYLPTGCNEDDSKLDWSKFDGGNVCNNCGAFNVCDDRVNLLNFARVRRYFDLAINGGYKPSKALDELNLKYKVVDLDLWRPDMEIPAEHRLPDSGKVRILHSSFVKNSGRNWKGRDIKGSRFVLAAVKRLQDEGYPVEFVQIENTHSSKMRYYQAQADIIVEQLIYGWFGSTGVEALAVGKPVVCYVRKTFGEFFLQTFPEYAGLPIVNADPDSLYQVLKELVVDADYRHRIGLESRRFAEAHFDPQKNVKAFADVLEAH